MGAGTLLGASTRSGPGSLFPLELLAQERLSSGASRSGSRSGSTGRGRSLFLGQVLLAAALLARRRSWRAALPLVVFTGLALMSSRNVAVASLVILPGMAAVRPASARSTGCAAPGPRSASSAVCVVAGCVLGVSALTGPDTQLRPYPEQAVTWLEEHGRLDDRLVAPDYVGNYLEARYGARGAVFIDDRVDMYPASVVDDSLVLLRAEPGWQEVLDRYDAGRGPLAEGQAPHPAPRAQPRLAARLRRRRLDGLGTVLRTGIRVAMAARTATCYAETEGFSPGGRCPSGRPGARPGCGPGRRASGRSTPGGSSPSSG